MQRRRLTRRLRSGERGQATAELVGMLWLLLLGALVVWQLLLAAWATESASNAARTGSRIESRGGDGASGAKNSLSSPLRKHARVSGGGETTTVRVRVPVIVPGISLDQWTVTKSATMPRTGT